MNNLLATFQLPDFLDLLHKLLSLGGYVVALLLWLDSQAKKRYAAQRDFEEIKTSIDILERNQEEILKTIERHETNTFKNYTEVTNRIFRDLDMLKQLINTQALLIAPEEKNSGK
ncbi:MULTISPECIES: hypothetical protein [Aerosakkonema]|uniref:hypothetical protein n=1 Tax=Aerosakkonema TaxID=1246629 RepID=UPI0035B89641